MFYDMLLPHCITVAVIPLHSSSCTKPPQKIFMPSARDCQLKREKVIVEGEKENKNEEGWEGERGETERAKSGVSVCRKMTIVCLATSLPLTPQCALACDVANSRILARKGGPKYSRRSCCSSNKPKEEDSSENSDGKKFRAVEEKMGGAAACCAYPPPQESGRSSG